MNKIHSIKPQELNENDFSPFGQIIHLPAHSAPKRGESWDCWNCILSMGENNPSIGIVNTRAFVGHIKEMERHPKTELIIPINGVVVQPVALPGSLGDVELKPNASSVRAFIIQQKMAVLLAPGVWHWAAIPLHDEEATYFYLTEPTMLDEKLGSWVQFQNNDMVSVLTAGDY